MIIIKNGRENFFAENNRQHNIILLLIISTCVMNWRLESIGKKAFRIAVETNFFFHKYIFIETTHFFFFLINFLSRSRSSNDILTFFFFFLILFILSLFVRVCPSRERATSECGHPKRSFDFAFIERFGRPRFFDYPRLGSSSLPLLYRVIYICIFFFSLNLLFMFVFFFCPPPG